MLLFVLIFVLSGEFALSRIPFSPIELKVKYITAPLAFVGLIVLGVFRKVHLDQKCFTFMLLSTMLFFLIILSAFWSEFDMGMYRALLEYIFAFLVASAVFLCASMSVHETELMEPTLRFFSYIGLLYALQTIFSSVASGARGTIGIGGPNVATRVLFFAAISSFHLYGGKSPVRVMYLSFAAAQSLAILLIGSRGGFVAAITAVMYYVLARADIHRRLWSYLKYTALFASMSYIFLRLTGIYGTVREIFLNRYVDLLLRTQYAAGRDFIMTESVNLFLLTPILGQGLGSYYGVLGTYPHNVILEVGVNAGLVGLVIFLPLLYQGLTTIHVMRQSQYRLLSIFPLYMIIVSSVSGNVYDFRYFFFWAILLFRSQYLEKYAHLRNVSGHQSSVGHTPV